MTPDEAVAPDGLLLSAIAAAPSTIGASVDPDLLTAYAAAAAPHTRRALLADIRAFVAWCRGQGAVAVPAAPATVAAYLQARGDRGAAAASLTRYKASLARLHVLAGLPDPTRAPLVLLTLKALRRSRGAAQRQARPLRFNGAVADVRAAVDDGGPKGLSLSALLAACAATPEGAPEGARDAALLSVAYDTGLRAAELVALTVEDLLPAIDPHAGLVAIRRSKGDPDGEGATAYLSPRSMRALAAWRAAAGIESGPLFRRVFLRKLPPRLAVPGEAWARLDGGLLRHGRHPGTPALPARVKRTIGTAALAPGSLTGIYRRVAKAAFEQGRLADLSRDEFEGWVRGISAHSTRVGLTQDLFSAGEDLAGIMDALRWKSPRMPLLYNRNLTAESGAARRVVGRL